MGTAEEIQEMQRLLASIREAIRSHGADNAGHTAAEGNVHLSGAAGHAEEMLAETPNAVGMVPDERGLEYYSDESWLDADDDVEWVAAAASDAIAETSSAPTQAAMAPEEAWQQPETMLAHTGTEGGMPFGASPSYARAATAATRTTPAAAAAPAARKAQPASTRTDAAPSAGAAPRFAVLSGGRSDASVLGDSRLSAQVQQRVKAAMARMERIEAAKRALGGEAALRRLVADLVEPLIENWLNEHLADIVERRVQAELDRLLRRED